MDITALLLVGLCLSNAILLGMVSLLRIELNNLTYEVNSRFVKVWERIPSQADTLYTPKPENKE